MRLREYLLVLLISFAVGTHLPGQLTYSSFTSMATSEQDKLSTIPILGEQSITPPPLISFFQMSSLQGAEMGLGQPHQAFFCRMEWAWEKKTGLPVKFRLGSYEYTNWLEGKPISPISVFDQ